MMQETKIHYSISNRKKRFVIAGGGCGALHGNRVSKFFCVHLAEAAMTAASTMAMAMATALCFLH